LNKRIKKQHI